MCVRSIMHNVGSLCLNKYQKRMISTSACFRCSGSCVFLKRTSVEEVVSARLPHDLEKALASETHAGPRLEEALQMLLPQGSQDLQGL